MMLIFATLTVNVIADVPNTISITRRTEGGNTIIDVKVRHADPSTNHYISQINLDLDGTIKSFTGLSKATTTEAIYSLNIGSVNPKVVKSQAVCNTHGAGAYYSESGTNGTGGGGGIPAYPIEAVIIGALLGVAILLTLRNPRINSEVSIKR
jgi:desulfoferrodoxin (superoxide reductase-like protein)